MVLVIEIEKNGQTILWMEFVESGNQMQEMRNKNFF